jgi:hypothetical protein
MRSPRSSPPVAGGSLGAARSRRDAQTGFTARSAGGSQAQHRCRRHLPHRYREDQVTGLGLAPLQGTRPQGRPGAHGSRRVWLPITSDCSSSRRSERSASKPARPEERRPERASGGGSVASEMPWGFTDTSDWSCSQCRCPVNRR